MSRWIRWMRGTALGERLRKQIVPVSREHVLDRRRNEQLRIDWIGRCARELIVNAAPEDFRPKPPVRQPLLVPPRLESCDCRAAHEVQQAGNAPRNKRGLGSGRLVRMRASDRPVAIT